MSLAAAKAHANQPRAWVPDHTFSSETSSELDTTVNTSFTRTTEESSPTNDTVTDLAEEFLTSMGVGQESVEYEKEPAFGEDPPSPKQPLYGRTSMRFPLPPSQGGGAAAGGHVYEATEAEDDTQREDLWHYHHDGHGHDAVHVPDFTSDSLQRVPQAPEKQVEIQVQPGGGTMAWMTVEGHH